MKLICSPNDLLNKLSISIQTTDNTNINPYLSGLLIQCNSDNVIITSSNNIHSSTVIIKDNIQIEETGSILIKGQLLFNLLNGIKADKITIQTIEENVLTITANKDTYNLNLLDVNSYPQISFEHDKWLEFNLNSDLLREVNSKISSCVAQNLDFNHVLSGILFNSTDLENKIEIIATDSFHLGYICKPYDGNKFKFIIDPATIRFIENVVKTSNVEIKFYLNNQKLIFEYDNNLFLCKLLEGNYPLVNKTLNIEYPLSFTIDKNKLNNAINLGEVLANSNKKPTVSFKINRNNIELSTRSIEYGTSNQIVETEESNITEDLSYTFVLNIRFLNHIIKAIDSKKIIFNLIGENKQILIKEKDNEDYKYLILPVRN